MKFDDYKIGMKDSISKVISENDIINFAEISEDKNPIHLSEEYAKGTIFKKRIAHGMLSASLISAILGTKLPGKGSIYLNQTLEFLKPVYINDLITAEVEIIELIPEKNKIILKTICKNQNADIVLNGKATILKNENLEGE